jgi:hypothetical protein
VPGTSGAALAIVAAGVFVIIAIGRRGERSVFVIAALPIWLFGVFSLIGELVQLH